MSTWNRKDRIRMGAFQRTKLAKKRQVFCAKCDKIHNYPVCNPVVKRRRVRSTLQAAINKAAKMAASF